MQESNKTAEYLQIVCEQIRWKRSHLRVTRELEDHLQDQCQALQEAGWDPQDAEQEALRQMGDPVMIGAEFDKVYRPKTNWKIIAAIAGLLLLGVISQGFAAVEQSYYIPTFIIHRALKGIFYGSAAFLAAWFLDIRMIARYSAFLYTGYIGVIVFFFWYLPQVNGKTIHVAFLLLLFPVILTGMIYRMKQKSAVGILVCTASIIPVLLVGLIIPSVSGTLYMLIPCWVMLNMAVWKQWFGVRKAVGAAVVNLPFLFAVSGLTGAYYSRIAAALQPEQDPFGRGYVGMVLRNIVSRFQWFGQGEAPYIVEDTLPGLYTDHLLTFLIYRFGWVMLVVIMVLLLTIIYQGIVTYRRQKSFLGQLVVVSIVLQYGLQCFGSILNFWGITLLSEFPLPFLSGNLSMLINMAMIGMLMSLYRSGEVQDEFYLRAPLKFKKWDKLNSIHIK